MTDHDVGRLTNLLDVAVTEAKFVAETVKAGDMELTPSRHLRWSTTVENRIELDAQALKKLYDDAKYYSRNLRVRVNARDNEGNFHRSLKNLISEISRFNLVHNQQIGHVFHNIIKGPTYYQVSESGPDISTTISHVNDMVEYLVLQAALTNSNTAATSLFEWAEGKGLAYETRVLIGGIKIDNLIRLDEGVHFERLPDRVSDLSGRLSRNASIAESDYLGRVLLVIKCSVEPALWKPSQKPNMTAGWALGSYTIQDFCKAISVICDTEVNNMMSWHDYGHVEAFRTGTAITISTMHHRARQRDLDIQTGKEELTSAFNLLKQSEGKNNLRVGMAQWVKSKRHMLSDVDRLIYLRTALESVLLEGGDKSEMRFRLALHGARLVGSNKNDRKMYYQKLRKLYDLASTAVHSGKIKGTNEDRELLQFGQDFCRRAIIPHFPFEIVEATLD